MNRILEAIRCEGKKARLLKFEEKLFPMIERLRIRRDVSEDCFAEFYEILRFIDESPLIGNDFRQKYTYIAIAKSTLSQEQLSGLFTHVPNHPDAHHFRDLIEKYFDGSFPLWLNLGCADHNHLSARCW